jgi:hypothetical protein
MDLKSFRRSMVAEWGEGGVSGPGIALHATSCAPGGTRGNEPRDGAPQIARG